MDFGVPNLLGENPPVSPFEKGGNKKGGFVAAPACRCAGR